MVGEQLERQDPTEAVLDHGKCIYIYLLFGSNCSLETFPYSIVQQT